MALMNTTAQGLLHRLPRLAQRCRAGEFDEPVFAALYFFHWQMAIHGRQFAARKARNDLRPNAREWLVVMETARGEELRERLLYWLERYQFRSVIRNVPIAMVQWLLGAWPLKLREDIPSPREVLHWQAQGQRAVTVLTKFPRMCEPVLNKANAFVFFLHDLEHAYKFFHSPALRAGQCAFFAALENAFERGVFAPYFDDAEFVKKFHYLMSDMNTHPEHSRQYLRAILVEFYLRHERKGYQERLSSLAEENIEEMLHAVAPSEPMLACA